jgi:hypothetical protein
VDGLQAPASWHWSLAAHTTGFCPWQTPAWQLEACVQAFPSSQLVPLARGVAWHLPAALHDPTLQASFSDEQSMAAPAWHCKVCKLHVSMPLQALPSLQSALVLQAQLPEFVVQPPSCSEQLSTVQLMPSLQV